MANRISVSIKDEDVYQYMKNIPNLSNNVQQKYENELKNTTRTQQEHQQTNHLIAKQHQGINTIISLFGIAAIFIGITLLTNKPHYLYPGVFFTIEGIIAMIIGLLGINDTKKTLKQHQKEAVI